ncbi:hypothetical protein [Halobacteriovorax sp. JY17]|uniref:hypothetical protein n=1 Tax=Halobacteriovorax sp. JY17 TaxID=2014617 RepID=UPI000C37AFEE|nr:hypothetical protein [Halobacteriovorax sp. JY17]PIK14459.1 MAG: hypothetical protein CES88_08940 [Halobacteriovorax sp. JY17]
MKLCCRIFFFIFTLLLTSCFKQDTPEVVSDQTRTTRDLEQLEACSDITFYEGFLYRKNLLNLFVCTSWDLKFVEMFKALAQTSDRHWNDLVTPIDEMFFGDRARRDRFIKYYQDLDSDGALDDLGRVITALTDTNFYDGLNALFVCAENQEDSVCENREKLVSKDEIKDLMLLLNRDPQLILELSKIVDGFHFALGKDAEPLRREIVKFNNTTFFNKLRILTVSKFAQKYLDELKRGDLELLKGFFLAKEGDSNQNWVNSWIKREDVSEDYLSKIVHFPVQEQPQLVRDIKVLNQLYNSNISCSDENLQLSIDIKSLVGNTIQYLKKDDIVRFFDSLLMANESVVYARPICPDLTDANRVINYYEYSGQRNVNHTIDLSNILKYSVELLAKNPTIDLTKFVLELVDYDHGYLIDFLGSDVFNIVNEVNKVVVENSEGFYRTSLGILKRTDEQIYYSLAYILNDLFSKATSSDLRAWTKSWLFWNEQEQNFLFKFIDIHLDSNTDFVRLFSFYSLFLKEVSSDWERLGNYYNKDENTRERTYQALKFVLSRFHGSQILGDYKKFFSRDHILELLKVITSGGSFKESALSRLSIRNIDNQTPLVSPVVQLVTRGERDNSRVADCARSISESASLFDLINSYPESCRGINETYALDNISQGISIALGEFQKSYPNNVVEHFFEVGGLLSPEMSMWMISSAVSMESHLNENGKGISFVLDQLKTYFLDIGEEGAKGTSVIKKGLELIVNWLGEDSERDLRNGMISELVVNKSRADELYKNLPFYINDFEAWNKKYIQPVYEEREEFSCQKYLNTHVGKSICPSVEKAKENINLLAKQLVKRHEVSEGIPVEYIIRAALPDGGVMIPLDGEKTKKKRLTLLETFNYLFDLSDKELKVNKEKVKYRDSLDGDKEYYTMTTNERIDHVIRNVAFGHNYLGVQYLNAVVKGDDYSDVVKEKQRLMGICLNTPGVRCGKSMSKEERRMGKNAFWAYDGLVDVNNGNDLEPRMKYGEYMQAFMFSFVASSALKAQEVKLFPLDDDELKKHNGKALGYFSEVAAFSNMGRVVHDRVGRTRAEFEEFIASPQFKRVNDLLLSRVSEREIVEVAEQLFKTISSDDQGALSDLVEWINELSYSELRMAEEIVAKSIYISTYLGSEKQVFGTGDNVNFSSSTSFEILYIVNRLMNEYKQLKKSFGEEYSLRSIVPPTLNAVSFIYEKLSNEGSSKKYWYLLNSGYAAFREVFYIRGAITSFLENVVKKNRASSVYELVSNVYKYLVNVESVGAKDLSDTLRISYESSVGSETLWRYLEGTTVRSFCSQQKEVCEENKNYDDLNRIGYVLSQKSNLKSTLEWLLIENKQAIINTTNDFFPFLKIVN